jgi:hypothetical protein
VKGGQLKLEEETPPTTSYARDLTRNAGPFRSYVTLAYLVFSHFALEATKLFFQVMEFDINSEN